MPKKNPPQSIPETLPTMVHDYQPSLPAGRDSICKTHSAHSAIVPEYNPQILRMSQEFNSLLARGLFSENAKLIGFVGNDWLWTFTKVQGIEPTNNAAERALRPAVIYRKLSFGTQSEAASANTVETTVVLMSSR